MISELLYTDIVWFVAGFVLLIAYFSFRKKFPHHAIFSLEYENFSRSVIIPVVVVFVVLSAFRFVSGVSLVEKSLSWFSVLSYVITGPFFEELFFRGLILGGSFFMASRLESKIASYFFVVLGFIVQLVGFVWIHGYSDIVRITYLLIIGLCFSLLFLFNKREILPSIVAHSLTNLLVILGVFK